jgi:DNA modification methylase
MGYYDVGKARIWLADCLEVAGLYPENHFQLLLTSTPYPGLAGFDMTVGEYFAWWLVRLQAWLPRMNQETGVIVQVVKFGRKKDGQFDIRLFDLAHMYESLGLYCIDVFPWDKKNSPPSGNHDRHDRDAYEVCFAFGLSKGFTYNKLRKAYAKKTVMKAASGNMRKSDVRGALAHGHDNLHSEGATLDNVLRISPTGGEEQHRPRVAGGSFPLELADRFILEFSNVGDFVLDPFCGAGTVLARTLIHNRLPVGIDIDERAIKTTREWCADPYWVKNSKTPEERQKKWQQTSIL